MDPSSISPPPASAPAPLQAPALNTVPFAAEPNNHPPAAASAPPAAHPPYAEMIYTAIEALKEKNGSSKRAIGKYIEQVYKEQLPPTHETLLSHHLKRLKNNGMLVMFKKSYKLPRSAPGDADASASAPAPAPAPAPAASTTPGSRPRGRPRKTQPQPNVQAQNVPLQPLPAGDVNNAQQQNAEPVWAALGLADEPMPAQPAATESNKRRPGRPRKSVAPGLGQPGPFVASPARRGRPPGSRSQKRPGRPKANPAAAVAVSGGPKRRPGRPPKNQQQQATPIPFAVIPATAAAAPEAPAEQPGGGAVAAVGTPGRRGRPRKNAAVAAAVAAANVAVGGGRGGGRGRGRGGGGRGRGRGRGRGGLAVQPKNPTGRRPGRPKKGTTSAAVSQNAAANEDLKRKLEHFQSKVKESLAVLKPHFNHESPVTAIAAIQELEVLGTMDLNAPFRDETLPQQQQLPPQEPPPQQQQLPPQQQLLPQQQQPLQQHLPPQQLPQPQVYQQQFPQFHLQQYHHQQQLQFQQQQQPQLYQHQASPPHHQQQFHP